MPLYPTIKKLVSLIQGWAVAAVSIFYVTNAPAQFFPVQVTPQLIPPYSVYLTDYAAPGSEKLRVIILQRDLTQPVYQLRLVMSVEWNGKVIMRTSRAFQPRAIQLDPGVPTIISGTDLSPYLDSRNIDFVGYSREQYERTRALPEGSYRIFFTAYDYRRQDVQVSNEGSSFYYLSKNEPPLINFPACGTTLPFKDPQQIIFSWLPRNTASPTSAADTEYEFTLYETRPTGRNPNDVVLSSQPIFRTRTDATQLVYGPAEPVLLEGMKYVWRVQAIDKNGRDAFRNNGFSEVCTFTYSGGDAAFDIGVVKNLQAQGETEHRGKIWWEASGYDSYKVYYKKTGTGYEWFSSIVTRNDLKLFDLETDTEYETRVQVKKSGVFGPYSEIVKFRTTQQRVLACGEDNGTLAPGDESNPLQGAYPNMIIEVDGLEVMVSHAVPLGSGWYKGTGTVTTKLLGASFHVSFERLFIDENLVAGKGRIDFVTKGVAELVNMQMANQQQKTEELNKSKNLNEDADSPRYIREIIFSIPYVIDSVYFADEKIVITNSEGEVEYYLISTDVERETITILDSENSQYTITPDKKIIEKASPGNSPDRADTVGLDDFGKIVKMVIDSIYSQRVLHRSALIKVRDTYQKDLDANVEIINSVELSVEDEETTIEENISVVEVFEEIEKLDVKVEEEKKSITKINAELELLNGYLGRLREFVKEVSSSYDFRTINSRNEKVTKVFEYIEKSLK